MDEFCANKDSQLKRCACSSRIHEFDSVKKQLSAVDDKMLDFSQRLLTVNMDKEDAQALFQATEGELAFNQKDTSSSKKMLDEIAKKLNTSFDSSNFDTNLSALSWSLNADAAFDSVDSMLGASTTSKTGTDLYAAALPVCREMALEVCSEDELAIATSGYQMMIEQDCNTVAKSYSTQTDQAREKVLESSALLDMSRLDVYQKRNSDDILTCKKKMLDKLTDSTVCGTNLGKCLDTSGQYIDPSTGEAFLTVNLADLGSLISRPQAGQTWTGAPGNDKFVSYLNSKKKYLEPAMENCQDISDYVWQEFIEDALAQIKLAQEDKLEEMRQSCTTLTTQCLSDTAESLADFDARALSTFGVAADKTVNAMCAEVKNACTALLDASGGGTDWNTGMSQIASDKTYETIMQTCREVGRACIIQACKSISGNFGLCENIQTSVNRKAIINRTSCWKEVKDCVASAGGPQIDQIMEQLIAANIASDNYTFYDSLYGSANQQITGANHNLASEISTLGETGEETPTPSEPTPLMCYQQSLTENPNLNCIYDICATECGLQPDGTYNEEAIKSTECHVCRISEKIWGNCETQTTSSLDAKNSHNRIRIPINDQTTLMSWFAINTSTDQMDDSCRDTSCGVGYTPYPDKSGNIMCVDSSGMINGEMCYANDGFSSVTVGNDKNHGELSMCCRAGLNAGAPINTVNDKYCCDGTVDKGNKTKYYFGDTSASGLGQICLPTDKNTANAVAAEIVAEYNYIYIPMTTFPQIYIICLGEIDNTKQNNVVGYPNGTQIKCNGKYMLINKVNGAYFEPEYDTLTGTTSDLVPVLFYDAPKTITNTQTTTCKASQNKGIMKNGKVNWPTTDPNCLTTNPTGWQIGFGTDYPN